jgi:Spy/CpxP family protein refolding chaperone
VRALRLTPAQAAAIDGAYGRSRQKREAVGRLQRAGRQRLAEALGQPALDTRALDRVVADLARLQRKRLRSIVALRLAARRILTPPQLTRLLELRPALMSQRWDRPRRTRPSRARVSTPTQ